MSKKVHGSYYLDSREGQTFITDDRDGGSDIGFRLVYDSEDRVFRCGCWDYDPQYARVGRRVRLDPDYRYGLLGFRLVREGT